jgi:hypothetical protein
VDVSRAERRFCDSTIPGFCDSAAIPTVIDDSGAGRRIRTRSPGVAWYTACRPYPRSVSTLDGEPRFPIRDGGYAMNPERSRDGGVVTPHSIRDYIGWWSYLAVMGGLGSEADPFAPDGRLDAFPGA